MGKKQTDPSAQRLLLQRIAAYLIDIVIVFLGMELLAMLLGINRIELSVVEQMKFNITSNVFFSLYSYLFATFLMKGQTPGKRLVGLRVVSLSTKDGSLIAAEMLFREVIGKLFIEKANLWIAFILVATGAQELIFNYIDNGAINTTLYYIMMIPWPLLISISMVINRDDHRSLHDMVANTSVVSAEKAKTVFRYR